MTRVAADHGTMGGETRMARFLRVFVPFADVATADLPLGRLIRLSLFQLSVGITLVLLGGTLNRVMAVELGIPVTLIASAMALPLLLAPARMLIGFKSDHRRSYLGWRRTPYVWLGAMAQFGGLAIMPFSLLLVSEGVPSTVLAGKAGLLLAFFMVGCGVHTVQTAGLALASDLAQPDKRPRVVAMLYTMLLVGMFAGAIVIGRLLNDFSPMKLIQLLQGSAVVTILLTLIAIWQQEPRRRDIAPEAETGPKRRFIEDLRDLFASQPDLKRLFAALAVGTAAFSMQDVLLEPYGAEVFKMSVGATTLLTALFASGSLLGFFGAARLLGGARNGNPHVVAALGLFLGLPGFSAVVMAGPLLSVATFSAGTFLIGLGSGFFSVSILLAVMERIGRADLGSGLVLGAWGAVQAIATGLAVVSGGVLRDQVARLADVGVFGPAFQNVAAGYGVVYHFEIGLLFAALLVLGPLVRPQSIEPRQPSGQGFGLPDLPN